MALVLVGLYAATRLAAAKREMDAARREIVAARDALMRRDADAALAALDRADRRFAAAISSAGTFPLGLVQPVPLLGTPSRAIDTAAAAGRDATRGGRSLAKAVAALPTSGALGIDGHDLSAVHVAATRSRRAIAEADTAFRAADERLAPLTKSALPPIASAARDLRSELDAAASQLYGGDKVLQLVGDLTAPGTHARILVLSQDTMELRATGGYIGSFGVVDFDGGTARLERYDSFESLPDPQPAVQGPGQFAAGRWALENVNWWPDFPTTAAAAKDMFRRQGGGDVDAVVAVTEDTMARLVGVLGPIRVPGYERPVTEQGFAQRVLYEVELKRPQDNPRKRFLTELSKIVFNRLLSLDPDEVSPVVDALRASVRLGDVQVWFSDPARQRLVAGSAWSGELPKTDDDFLMLVDTNMTASKANADLIRTVDYRVRRAGRDLVGEVHVRYENRGAKSAVNPYYNGYLRVYVPEAAVPEPGIDAIDEGRAADGAYRVFARPVIVQPKQSLAFVLRWRLPGVGRDRRLHEVTWVRQVGTRQDAFAVTGADKVDVVAQRVARVRVPLAQP